MHSSLGVTLLVYVEQYSGRNYSSLSVRNWTTKKERSITKSWKNTRIVESEKCFRIETEAAVCTTCCSRWSRWFPGRSRKSAWVEIYRIRAVLDSRSFDSLFRVHESTAFTQPCHYTISYLCALELAYSQQAFQGRLGLMIRLLVACGID